MISAPDRDDEEPLGFVEQWENRFAGRNMPREFFPLLHSVADYLRVSKQAERSANLLRCESGMGVERYLGHRLEHARLLVLALFEAGKKEDALPVLEYYAARPYLFEDQERQGFFLFCRGMDSLEQGEAQTLAHCLMLLTRTRAGARDACLLRITHQAGGLGKLFAAAGRPDLATRALTAIFWGTQRLANRGVAAGIIGRGLHFFLSMLRSVNRLKGANQAWMLRSRASKSAPRPAPGGKRDKRPIVVARAMGGIGDILMMTPGLKALRRKYPDREIHFTIPKAFHGLLNHNPDVVLHDINDQVLYREDCFVLYNLTECPASRVESATLPTVRRSRIDIFAAAMGIGRRRLNRVGRTPVYTVTEEEKTWAGNFFTKHGLVPEQCIAVQPYAADSYKDYPHMESLVARLADTRPVLVFHGSPLQGFDHPQVFKIDKCSLRQSIALLFMCELLVAVDSAFVHIAAAFGKRTVALFGPTDGAIFTRHYPNCTVVHGYAEAGCTACWRNQGLLCGKTRTVQSACLGHISVDRVLEIILREKHDKKNPSLDTSTDFKK